MSVSLFEFVNVMITAVCSATSTIKSFNDSLLVEKKGDGSEVTQVDSLAQQIIFSIIRKSFPELNIIGEEDVDVDHNLVHELPTVQNQTFSFPNRQLQLDDIVVYVDPLDGTNCYIRGKLECVCVLLGATYQSKPLFGAVSRPFISEEVTYAITGHPPFNLKQQELGTDIIFTCSRRNDISEHPFKVLHEGGSGAKMMLVAEQKADIYLHPLVQSCCWDTLAAQVIVEATGGLVVDCYGNQLHYPKSKKETVRHENGVICLSKRSVKYMNWITSLPFGM
ncbi:Inositol polyphosphate 1-phosphatase [Entamoeba marina]